MIDLAIIIPAYKNTFLEKVLITLSNQTNLDFKVYIGIDNSPYDLESIIAKFESKLNLVVHRFDVNIGGKDLVAQWERCIALSKEEKWIWLFSDDDELDPNCVDEFYQISQSDDAKLYRFDTCRINNESEKSGKYSNHVSKETGLEFIKKRLYGEVNSYVVEYIFAREIYTANGGFENFPAAWASDDATWLKFSENSDIVKIPNACVYWRYSGENISSNKNNIQINAQKMSAAKMYASFVKDRFPTNNEIHLGIITWYWKQYHFHGNKSIIAFLKDTVFLSSLLKKEYVKIFKTGLICVVHQWKKKIK